MKDEGSSLSTVQHELPFGRGEPLEKRRKTGAAKDKKLLKTDAQAGIIAGESLRKVSSLQR